MFSSGRKLAVVVALALLMSGAVLGLMQLQSARNFRSTTGTVTTAEMDTYDSGVGARTSGETTFYQPNVTYTYTVDAETYTADNIAFGTEIDTNSQGRAVDVLSKFGAGESVTVYYDPANPEHAYLIPRLDFLPAGALMIGGLLLFADALTPWSSVSRAVLARIPLTMHLGSRFSTESPRAVSPENPTAILEARETLDAPRTAPLWGTHASAVWLACGVSIALIVLGYLLVSHPPYDVAAYGVLSLPVVLNLRILMRVGLG